MSDQKPDRRSNLFFRLEVGDKAINLRFAQHGIGDHTDQSAHRQHGSLRGHLSAQDACGLRLAFISVS